LTAVLAVISVVAFAQ